MKKLLLALLLTACVSAPKKQSLLDVPVGRVIQKPAFAVAALESPTEPLEPYFSKIYAVSPTSPEPFLGWIKTSIGFKQGEISEAALQNIGLDLPYVWRVLTKWPDGSVRVGQIKHVAYFGGMGLVPLELKSGKNPYRGFKFHPKVAEAVVNDSFVRELKFSTIVSGAQVVCVPTAGQYKFLHVDDAEMQIRFRSKCQNNGADHALSMTSVVSIFSEDPVIRMTAILGNDTRELAVGTITLGALTITSGALPMPKWVAEQAHGSKAAVLGDGQTWAFKLIFNLDPNFESTARHMQSGEPMGFQYYPDAVASKAFGDLPATRIPLDQIQVVHSQVTQAAVISSVPAPQSYMGMVNLNPGATGDQPDFASTQPIEVQKAAQAYSSKQMARVLTVASKESFRPSFFWETRNGVTDRVKATDYPELFFWSSRPHFHFSWNEAYPEWRSRTSNPAGFWPGEWSGWNSMDNQHYGHNHLRHAFLLTGDAYLEEVLKYYVSVTHWNYYTKWMNSVEAERAFGRTQKEAILLTQIFPDLPESQLLKTRIEQKAQVHRNAVTQNLTRLGSVSGSLFSGCDGRVNNGVWCPQEQALGQGPIVVVGWQTGFVLEALGMQQTKDLRYLEKATDYFLADGTPKTYHLATDPNQYLTGGIGVQWWSGWVRLALDNPQAPGAQFVLTKVKPVLDARFQNGCGFPSPYFCLNDSFKNY